MLQYYVVDGVTGEGEAAAMTISRCFTTRIVSRAQYSQQQVITVEDLVKSQQTAVLEHVCRLR